MNAPVDLLPYKFRMVSELVPYAGNARTHSPEQVEQIAALIRQFGFTNPVLVAGDNILAGHGRCLAAASIGMAQVPTIDLAHLTPVQQRAYILADNKSALNAGWDADLLRGELQALQAAGFDLDLTAFSAAEVADIFTVVQARDPDIVPAKQAEARSRLGDVWELGPHKVACGDATEQATWDALMGSERADICWTDPPYNVDYEGSAGKIANDHLGAPEFFSLIRNILVGVFQSLKPGGPLYVAHADTEGLAFRRAFLEAGFKLSGCLIWKKDALVLGRSDYQWMHEPILYGWKPGSRHRWHGGRKNTTIVDLGASSPFQQLPDGRWQIEVGGQLMVVDGAAEVTTLVPSIIEEPRPRSSTEHPTMKPVALVERMLRNSARFGDLVVDPCGGSGSTLVAADRLGMSCRAIELDPLYADVIVRRWQGLTGRKAHLVGSDELFGD